MSKSTASTTPRRSQTLDQLRQRVRELEQELAQRKETEQMLNQRVAVLHEHLHLLDVIHDALLVRDPEGKVLFWNRTAEQVYGWSREEATGSQAHALLQTQFPADLAAIQAQLVATNEWQGELVQSRRDGTSLIMISHWRLYRQAWDQTEVVVEVNRDITEARRTEMELRASEAELRALFAGINDVILVLDYEGYYRKIAPTNPQLLYKPPSEMIGKRLHEVMPAAQADFFLTIVRRALDSGHVVHTEYPLQIGEQEFWFHGAVSPLLDDAVIWIARDITERKRTDQEQVRLREQIIRTQAAMLAEMSTPLIPLNDQILVMPIIGIIDQQRSQALLTALLEGVSSQRAAVVILDITGVPQIDTYVAQILTQAAQNLKLLGAQVVLTGMRAEVAQSLVKLGIDLGEIVTRSTLQSGISYALEQSTDHNRW